MFCITILHCVFSIVTITSSRDFDEFLLTGVYTSPSQGDESHSAHSNLISLAAATSQPFAQNTPMCSPLHTHHSRLPNNQLSFTWRAPLKGAGCVAFVYVHFSFCLFIYPFIYLTWRFECAIYFMLITIHCKCTHLNYQGNGIS